MAARSYMCYGPVSPCCRPGLDSTKAVFACSAATLECARALLEYRRQKAAGCGGASSLLLISHAISEEVLALSPSLPSSLPPPLRSAEQKLLAHRDTLPKSWRARLGAGVPSNADGCPCALDQALPLHLRFSFAKEENPAVSAYRHLQKQQCRDAKSRPGFHKTDASAYE